MKSRISMHACRDLIDDGRWRSGKKNGDMRWKERYGVATIIYYGKLWKSIKRRKWFANQRWVRLRVGKVLVPPTKLVLRQYL